MKRLAIVASLMALYCGVSLAQCGIIVLNPLTGLLDCTGLASSGSVSSVGLDGTANQITVTGSSPITSSGSWTLSIPDQFIIPLNATVRSSVGVGTVGSVTGSINIAGSSGLSGLATITTNSVGSSIYVPALRIQNINTSTQCVQANSFGDTTGSGNACGNVLASGSLASSSLVAGGGSKAVQVPCSGCTLDSSGDLTITGWFSSGVGGSLAGLAALGSGTLPTFGAGSGEVPTTGYNGWSGAASGVSSSYLGIMPVAVPAAGQLMVFPAPTSGLTQGTWIGTGGSAGDLGKVIAAGTSALGTSSISSQTCATVVTTTATGAASTDSVSWNPNASIKAVTGYVPQITGGLYISVYLTSNAINWDVCNPTSGSITPGAVTLNWRIIR